MAFYNFYGDPNWRENLTQEPPPTADKENRRHLDLPSTITPARSKTLPGRSMTGGLAKSTAPPPADEVRDLGNTERRQLRSALDVLIEHKLKTRYQPEEQTRSWELIMRLQRKHIAEFLKESPSLRRDLPDLIATAHETARLKTADETGLELNLLPETYEWTVAEVLAETKA